MAQFILGSVNINGTAVSTLQSLGYDGGFERLLLAAASNHQAEFVALMRQMPRLRWATPKIDALDAVTLGSGSCAFRTVTEGGTGNSTWVSITGTAGAVLHIPRRITWSPGAPAVLEGESVFLSSNGSTAPITVGATAGATTAFANAWSGDEEQVYSIMVDFGFEIAFPQDGLLYQKHCFVVAQRPVIMVGKYDSADITTGKLNPGSVSSLTATLAAIADGGIRGTQKQFAVTGHLTTPEITGAKPGTVMVRCDGKNGITIT
jgi:hypothetical protein